MTPQNQRESFVISATNARRRCQVAVPVAVGVDEMLIHLGVGCGHFALGMYSFPTEHPHIPHFPVPKNASGFQYSQDRQNISRSWNVC